MTKRTIIECDLQIDWKFNILIHDTDDKVKYYSM